MTMRDRRIEVDLQPDDFAHAEEMATEDVEDGDAAEGVGYDFYADDLAYDAARERGYR